MSVYHVEDHRLPAVFSVVQGRFSEFWTMSSLPLFRHEKGYIGTLLEHLYDAFFQLYLNGPNLRVGQMFEQF